MANTVDKVIKIAEAEVGYLEKKTNASLTNKTTNAGSNNYTKYWADLAPGMNGQPWCNCFVNWIFVQAFGETAAKKLLCTKGSWSYYTPTSAGYFKNEKQWFTSNPQVGDIIYFKNSQRICHVGIVYKVDSTTVYTIEGNTSKASGVIANGGGVAKKSYSLTYSQIAGYGRPKYDVTSKTEIFTKPATATNPYIEPTSLIKAGSKGEGVKWVQWELNQSGANLKIDGDAGTRTINAVRQFQKKYKLEVDGMVGTKTRAMLKKKK